MLHGALTFDRGWTLVEDQLRPTNETSGSLFATSNGFLGVRGRRREPLGGGGLVLVGGCYETRPYAHPERSFGVPEHYQTIVPVTDPTAVAVEVDGVAVTPTSGTWHDHQRTLDLRSGIVTTTGRWQASDGGPVVVVRSTRLASLTEPGVVWSAVEVEPLDGAVDVVVTSALRAYVGDRTFPGEPEALSRAWGRVLRPAGHRADDGTAGLVHVTVHSGRAVAAAVAASGPGDGEAPLTVEPDSIRRRHRGPAAPGRPFVVQQRVGFAVGASAAAGAVLDEVCLTAGARPPGAIAAAVDEQRTRLDDWWAVAAVDLDGDPELEGMLRFAGFQVRQATAFLGAGERGVPAKGLTGQGYEGHCLWDQEVYVGHALALLDPDAARATVAFRCRTLPQATTRAAQLSQRGAQFPWRTIDGTEASAFFPAGAAQHHLNADIAWAIGHRLAVTGDAEILEDGGLELLVETARTWLSIGRFNAEGAFQIDGVTGPDEYTALVNNNLYTNLMAARNLELAAEHLDALGRRDPSAHAAAVEALGVEPDEPEAWRRAARAVAVVRDDDLGIHAQDDGFLELPRWDLAATPPEKLPLQDHHHLLTLYRHQVLKQADVVLATVLRPERFTDEDRRRNFDYYEPLTTHDSSLSAPIHAIAAARVGRLDRAVHHLRRTATTDLEDRVGTLADGLHLAAAAGAWLAVVRGFGGFGVVDDRPCFQPRLPPGIAGLRFRLRFRGSVLEVQVEPGRTSYQVLEGDPLEVVHDGEAIRVDGASAAVAPGTAERRVS